MRKGHPIGEQTFVMDPGDPAYQQFLLQQAQRHLRRLPDTDGLAIDRMDLIHNYNRAPTTASPGSRESRPGRCAFPGSNCCRSWGR